MASGQGLGSDGDTPVPPASATSAFFSPFAFIVAVVVVERTAFGSKVLLLAGDDDDDDDDVVVVAVVVVAVVGSSLMTEGTDTTMDARNTLV